MAKLTDNDLMIYQNLRGSFNHFYNTTGMLSLKLEDVYLANGPPQQKQLDALKTNKAFMDKMRQLNANSLSASQNHLADIQAEELQKQPLVLDAQVEEITTTDHSPHTVNCIKCKFNNELLTLMDSEIESWRSYVRFLNACEQQEVLNKMLEKSMESEQKEFDAERRKMALQEFMRTAEFKRLEIIQEIRELQALSFKLRNEIRGISNNITQINNIIREIDNNIKKISDKIVQIHSNIKEINQELSSGFKDVINSYSDSNNSDNKQNELLRYVGERVGEQIKKGEISMVKEEVEKAINRANDEYLTENNKEARNVHKDSKEILGVQTCLTTEIAASLFSKYANSIDSLLREHNNLQAEENNLRFETNRRQIQENKRQVEENRLQITKNDFQAVDDKILSLEKKWSLNIETLDTPRTSSFAMFKHDQIEKRIITDPRGRVYRNSESEKIEPDESSSNSRNYKP